MRPRFLSELLVGFHSVGYDDDPIWAMRPSHGLLLSVWMPYGVSVMFATLQYRALVELCLWANILIASSSLRSTNHASFSARRRVASTTFLHVCPVPLMFLERIFLGPVS